MAAEHMATSPQVIVREYDQFGINDLQFLSKRVCSMSPDIFVLISTIEKTLLLSRADSDQTMGPDCGNLIKLHAVAYHGKGGGSRSNGRAAFQSMAELDEFVQHLVMLLLEEV
jgi:alanyl-tRNA synthetase